MAGLFDIRMTLLERSLDLRTKRNEILSSNIANQETPGYKARDLVFEKALGEALEAQTPGPMRVTDPRHMDGRRPLPLEMVRGEVIQSANPNASLDGNTVDMEREMAKLAENQVAYAALTRMVSHKIGQLKLAMQSEQ
ncbi:MAG: flagellar basal body rod protein FlgB [Deltaproteobacteria bacterium]|nr:flagellar basal body rod protein FlgB [Deltaproteobacteria bacterium]